MVGRSPVGATGQAGDARTAAEGGAEAIGDADKISDAAGSSASSSTGLGAPLCDRPARAPPDAGSTRRGGVEEAPGQRLVAGRRTARICAPLWKACLWKACRAAHNSSFGA